MKSSKLQLKVKSSGRKIIKLLMLLGIREGYLLVRNLYGIIEHPFLTVKRIYNDKDYSQGILLFGLPIGLWFGWIFVLLVSRVFILSRSEKQASLIFGRLHFGILAKASFLASSFFVSLFFLFLGYWIFEVWKKGGKK